MSDDIIEVEFRDGTRWVAAYLVTLFKLAGLDTHTMTLSEAVARANNSLLRSRANEAQSTALEQHFRREPWER